MLLTEVNEEFYSVNIPPIKDSLFLTWLFPSRSTALRRAVYVCVYACICLRLPFLHRVGGRYEGGDSDLAISNCCRGAILILACCFKKWTSSIFMFLLVWRELKSINPHLESQYIENHRLERTRRVGRAVGSWQWAQADWKLLHFLHWVIRRSHSVTGHTFTLLRNQISRVLHQFTHNFWRSHWSQGYSTERPLVINYFRIFITMVRI